MPSVGCVREYYKLCTRNYTEVERAHVVCYVKGNKIFIVITD